MGRYEDDPLRQWKEVNRPDRETETLIWRWLDAAVAPEKAIEVEEHFEIWLKERQGDPPDLVACVAWYGYTRIMIKDWGVPIDIAESDFQRWRNAGYYPTIEDFEERLAGAAGGFLELGRHNPAFFVKIIQSQLSDKLDGLDELIDLPLQENYLNGGYTPRNFETELRSKFAEQGLRGKDFDDAVGEALLDGDDAAQRDCFDRPFALRQQLECFEWGMEKLRILAITEQSEELGLPNPKLHNALLKIDLNNLLLRLQEADVKLRNIRRHLAKYRYYDLNSEIAPERFWWRHWEGQDARRRNGFSQR